MHAKRRGLPQTGSLCIGSLSRHRSVASALPYMLEAVVLGHGIRPIPVHDSHLRFCRGMDIELIEDHHLLVHALAAVHVRIMRHFLNT